MSITASTTSSAEGVITPSLLSLGLSASILQSENREFSCIVCLFVGLVSLGNMFWPSCSETLSGCFARELPFLIVFRHQWSCTVPRLQDFVGSVAACVQTDFLEN